MKTIFLKNKYRKLRSVAAVVAIATLGLASCSKNESNEVNIIDGEEIVGKGAAALIFNNADIEDNQIISATGTGMAAKATTTNFEKAEWQSAGDFDVQIEFSPVSTVKGDIQQAGTAEGEGLKATARGLKANNSLMGNGKKYYLVIREKAGNKAIKYNGEHIAGTKKTVRIDPNIEYEWFAYSINEATVPVFNSSTGKVDKGALSNKDVLYAKGEITPVPGDNLMNIVFKRNTVKYKVKLNVRGLFAQIKSTSQIGVSRQIGSGFEAVSVTGNLNVFDGTYSDLAPSHALASTFVNGDGNQYGAAVQEGVVYSVLADPIASNTFAIGLPKLDLIMRDDGSNRTHTPANLKMQHGAFTPQLGHEYEISARMIESAVRVYDDSVVNNYSDAWWGRTNLTYRAGHSDQYIFRADNEAQPSIDNDFWGWKTRTPYGDNYGEVDPCTLVYPEGTWKMPTEAQGTALGKVKLKNKYENYNLIWGAVYSSGYDLDPAYNSVNTSYPLLSQNLYFTMYGYRRNEGGFFDVPGQSIIDSPVGFFLGMVGTGSGYYWTDGRPSGNSQQSSVIKWTFRRVGLPAANIFVVTWSDYAVKSYLDFSHKPIIGERKNQGANIRCVRKVAPTGA